MDSFITSSSAIDLCLLDRVSGGEKAAERSAADRVHQFYDTLNFPLKSRSNWKAALTWRADVG
jgi:hypothetical protein